MEAITAMPVSPAPVTDAASGARDPKGCDAADAKGFGDQLKHEIAARSTDPKDTPADDTVAADAPAEEKTGDAAAADALDPAVAALLADTAVQQPVAVALPVQPVIQPTVTAAETTPAGETAAEIAVADARPAGGQRAPADAMAGERAGLRGRERGVTERASAERGAVERNSVERAAGERDAFERVSAERLVTGPAEPRETRPLREADGRGFTIQDKTRTDSSAASFLQGYTVDRGAGPTDAPMPVSASAPTLDSLSAATLGAKWGAPVAAGGPEAAAASATARVDTPLGASGWGDAFQQKVVWMVDRQLERAELHINPPNLGPVDVMLNFTGDAAQITFTSPHAAVREAIEASLPDLRNALDQRGVSLGQTSVGADSGAAREQFAEQAREAARNAQNGRSGGALMVETPVAARAPVARRGLVDTFA